MFRSILVWALLTAYLVTLPVTGGGQCPCRFVQMPRTPHPAIEATAPPAEVSARRAPCKCCPQSTDRDASRRDGQDGRDAPHTPQRPSDGSCDHCLVLDATAVSASGERSGTSQGDGDADPLAVAEERAGTRLANSPHVIPVGPTPAPHPRAHLLRYTHAFRC